jgi:hypothetical protein
MALAAASSIRNGLNHLCVAMDADKATMDAIVAALMAARSIGEYPSKRRINCPIRGLFFR